MSYLSRRWLWNFFRRLFLKTSNRCSIRNLLSLWSLFRCYFKRPREEPGGLFITSPKTVELESVLICPSAQPELPGHIPFRTQPDHNILSSYESAIPFPGSNASRSSQHLGIVYIEENTLNSPSNLSAPPVPPEANARVPSPTLSFSSHDIPAASASPRVTLSGSDSKIFPILPSQFKRYERNVVIPNCYPHYTIEPLTLDFTPNKILSEWKPFMHPEGALYFFRDRMRVFTDAYLYDDQVFLTFNNILAQIEDFARTHNIELTSDVDLVLDLTCDPNGEVTCGYYFANHQKRLLFWLDQHYIGEALEEVSGATLPSHIGLEIESQYWYHCELFPSSRDLSIEIIDELRDAIIHATGDLLSSPVSTAPFNLDDLERMLRLINNIKANVGTQHGGSACILARYMSNFFHCRFINFHGQNGARLCRDQSVHGNSRENSTIINIISPILFYTSHTHLQTLAKLSVDHIVSRASWREVMAKLTSEWKESTLYSTVLLNANVAFLAIQSVDNAGNAHYRTPAQLSSYVSTVMSIGSVIFSLLLIQQHRQKADLIFFCNRSASWFGLETLAILYSLPYTLLMWGMVSFLVAISFLCFQTSYRLSQSLVGGCELAIAILVVWCIAIRWETNPYSTWSFSIWRPWRQPAIPKVFRERQWNWSSPFRLLQRLPWKTLATSASDDPPTIVQV